MIVHGFDWDTGNKVKCLRHGLTLEEIESVFRGQPFVLINEKHTSLEERFHAVGKTAGGRYAYVVFTFRQGKEEIRIRPISARFMHQKEIENYERQRKK
jgi:uncharacterized protein